ncbi:MAG: hypothetical protein DCC73_13050 [Proteobacteria bacterium]|nr:MAG: hypothetical protein DCC73_13050 [Pseudomonadota bacterium]
MRSLVRLALAGAAGFVLSLNAHAAPVTYEIGGTFKSAPNFNITVPFEGAAFSFQFTYDADNVQTVFEDPNISSVYDGAYTNFRFSTNVNGQPYVYVLPDIDPNTNGPTGRLMVLNNFQVNSYLRDIVQFGGYNDTYYLASTLDPELEINGYMPFAMVLEFGSILDLNGNSGLDFVTFLTHEFDPMALVNSGDFNLVSNTINEIGQAYMGVGLLFVSPELLVGEPIFDEYGWTAFRKVYTDFSYIRIIDNPVAAVDEPASLLISLMGFAATALYGWRRRRSRH